MKKGNKRNLQKGFGIIEILVATTVITISLVSLMNVIRVSTSVSSESFRKIKAEFLAEEGIEVVKILRDDSWASNISTLTSGTTYYPVFNIASSTWSLSTSSPGVIDNIYDREIIFSDVYRRDSDDDIIDESSSDAKTLDIGTKKITSRVSWGDLKQLEFVTYIADIFGE